MPCHHPLQAFYTQRDNGKKLIHFSNESARLFEYGRKACGENNLTLPCGRCMGCRLERSRQWAVRIMHEASLYEDNCFVTLTFDDKHLEKMCKIYDGVYSLDIKHVQNFMKKLRQKYYPRNIRVYYCGEYGDKLGRPHYHLCLFNLVFPDQEFLFRSSGFDYFTSSDLCKLWSYGHVSISDLTFDSAAYVARYCTKKISGPDSDSHYRGRLPEFAKSSLKPGIGHGWIAKYGVTDVFPRDELVVSGSFCKPPRYYDKFLEKADPVAYQLMKDNRVSSMSDKADDNSFNRLLVKEKCLHARFRKLVRKLEASQPFSSTNVSDSYIDSLSR